MLRSDLLRLRPVQREDLDDLYRSFNTLEHRGHYLPVALWSEPAFRTKFEEDGFWAEGEGMLVMVGPQDRIVGEIEYYPIAAYLTGFELSYLIFGDEHRGQGTPPKPCGC